METRMLGLEAAHTVTKLQPGPMILLGKKFLGFLIIE